MAPLPPIGRDAAIKMVEDGELPFSFGSPHPHVMVLEQDGKFRIRQLIVDTAGAKYQAARARSPSWMPEHHYALGQPTGEIYAEAASARELIEVMRTMDWPHNW